MPDFSNGNTNKLVKYLNIKKEFICFEISERHSVDKNNLEKIFNHYKDYNYNIAIDDFGVGFSGYKLLYSLTPDIIKIDRFFIKDIEKNIKKRIFVKNITHLATQLGIKVVAEGVETKAEFYTCKELGCHLAQGYLIQKPTTNSNEILSTYPHIAKIIDSDKRSSNKNNKIEKYIQKIEPMSIDSKMINVIEYFKQHPQATILPIINSLYEPIKPLMMLMVLEIKINYSAFCRLSERFLL